MAAPTLDQVVKIFNAVGDEYVHVNKLIEDLKMKGFEEIDVVAAIQEAIGAGIFAIDTHGGLCKKIS